MKPSRKGEKFGFCEICRCDFTISHGGKYDIQRHMNTNKHIISVKSDRGNAKLDTFLKSDLQSEVMRAELLFTAFLIEHHVPLSAADHAGPLFRKMFPKCEMAKNYGSGRTKTTALMHEMALNKTSNLVKAMQSGPFAISIDGSNDTNFKLYPVVVTYYNSIVGLVQSSLPNLEGDSTGLNISQLIVTELEKNNIPIENCIAFMADNASVMQGKKNGVVAFLKSKNANLISMGCSCHLVNLASEKGATTLPTKCDEMLIDIFYYLNKSIKRKEALKKFQNLHDKEMQKILKHVCTRWLSLGRSLSRLLDQWDPLLSFFKELIKSPQTPTISNSLSSYKIPTKKTDNLSAGNSEKVACGKRKLECTNKSSKKQAVGKNSRDEKVTINNLLSREEKIFMFLSCPLDKIYCLFLKNVIPIFEKVNALLQSGCPLIHKLRGILLKEVINSSAILEVDYHDEENYKDFESITVGSMTTTD